MSNPFAPDGPPNLDCFSVDPDDYRNAAQVFDIYSQYCRKKALSMEAILANDINRALLVEEGMERLYQILPQDWRW